MGSLRWTQTAFCSLALADGLVDDLAVVFAEAGE